MRKLALMLAQCLLLAGCAGLPQPREMGEMALVRTIGVDGGEDAVTLTVSTGQRSAGVEGEKQSALLLTGEGASLSAAAHTLRGMGESHVFFGCTDHVLVGAGGAGLEELLGWLANDSELSLGAGLWLLREGDARRAVESGGENGVEARLSALVLDGKLGSAPRERTAGEVYIGLLERGCAYVPLLTAGEELTPTGYALLKEYKVAGYLEGESARGLELLAEKPTLEIIEVSLPDNPISLRLTGAQVDCRPVFEGEELIRVEILCRVSVQPEQWSRTMTAPEREEAMTRVKEQLEGRMSLALAQMKETRAECVGIASRVSMAAPWRWDGLEEDWQERFAAADTPVEVRVSLG